MGFFSSSKTPGKGEAPPPEDADADANAGSATMTRAASSGDMTTIRVVATDAPAEAGGVPLAEVFDDPRWAEAVQKSPLAGCFLVTTCVDARTRPARARRRRDSPARISRSIPARRDPSFFHRAPLTPSRVSTIADGRSPRGAPRAAAPRAAAFRAFASPGPRTPQLRSLLSSHPSPPFPSPSTLDWIGKKKSPAPHTQPPALSFRFELRTSRRTIAEFASDAASRVLSYRSSDVIEIDAKVSDPSRLITATRCHVPLSCLATPQTTTPWRRLWVDVLAHLGDPAERVAARDHCARLLLAIPVLPQYWLHASHADAFEAFDRAWIHQELAYGRLDRDALEKFFAICVKSHATQTDGRPWRGAEEDLEGPKLMSRLIAIRLKAARSDAAAEPDVAWAACEWWARRRGGRGVAPVVTVDETDEECDLELKELVFNLSARQLADDPATNRAALERDPCLAWSVLKSYATVTAHEPADAYVAGLGVICAACGFPPIRDPLGAFKAKHLTAEADAEKVSDGALVTGALPLDPATGKLAYEWTDVDLDALNANHEVLRLCWRAVSRCGDVRKAVPDLLRVGVAPGDRAVCDVIACPPGMATLGLGPVRRPEDAPVGATTVFVGEDVALDLDCALRLDGLPAKIELRVKTSAEREASEAPGALEPGLFDAGSFGKDRVGYHPRCAWNEERFVEKDEARAKEDAEFERTLQNLWTAWLAEFDEDGSGTISFDELKAFASQASCSSADGYMKSLHEWASAALEDGSLREEFDRVDDDGSGQLEYPEFRALLWTEE